jgi:hypothetical protein
MRDNLASGSTAKSLNLLRREKKMDFIIENKTLDHVTLRELWSEIGRRLNIAYGKIQMTFHGGKPTNFIDIDQRIDLTKKETKQKQ